MADSGGIFDDKTQFCVPFLLTQLEHYASQYSGTHNPPPFLLGVNGIQGAGKTVLVNTIRDILTKPPYSLTVTSFSIDDLYLTHSDQVKLAVTHPNNPLLQHRGQPSTHDVVLGARVLDSLLENKPTRIPVYDKSAHGGQGDREPESEWPVVNDTAHGQQLVRVVMFEGWCLGFRHRPEAEVRKEWENAVRARTDPNSAYDGRLGYANWDDVRDINEALKQYDAFTDRLNAFIHLDAQETHWVYEWRQEQERGLIAAKGRGMTPEQVKSFVDGYFPSYELYLNSVRAGVFKRDDVPVTTWRGRQLRIVVDRNRRLCQITDI